MLRPRPLPPPGPFVVKNGSKARCAHLGRHARAGVGHRQHDVGAGLHLDMDRQIVLVDLGLARLDRGAARRPASHRAH